MRCISLGNPKTCPKCKSKMNKAGYGKYPWECISKDQHPDAMVYMGCSNPKCDITGYSVDITDTLGEKLSNALPEDFMNGHECLY